MGLEQIPDNWIGVISALAGGLLVGIFALLSKYIDKVSEAKAISRTKLEELHLLVSEYSEAISRVHAEAYQRSSAEVGTRVVADHFRKILFEPLVKMQTLQNLYAPSIAQEFSRLSDLTVPYIMAATEFVSDPRQTNERLDECHENILDATIVVHDDLENIIFRSGLIPNQTFTDKLKASWKYAGKRAGLTKKPKELECLIPIEKNGVRKGRSVGHSNSWTSFIRTTIQSKLLLIYW